MTIRSGKTGLGTHSYKQKYEFTRMGDGRWYVFLDGKDTGYDFETLRDARKWASQQTGER